MIKKLKNPIRSMLKRHNAVFKKGAPNIYSFLIEKGVSSEICDEAAELVSGYVHDLNAAAIVFYKEEMEDFHEAIKDSIIERFEYVRDNEISNVFDKYW